MGSLVHQSVVVYYNPREDCVLLEEASHLEEAVGAPISDVEVVAEEHHGSDALVADASVFSGLPEVRVPAGRPVGEGEGEVERHRHQVEVGDFLEPGATLHQDELVLAAISGEHADLIWADLQFQKL
jgi:hypothetical protein